MKVEYNGTDWGVCVIETVVIRSRTQAQELKFRKSHLTASRKRKQEALSIAGNGIYLPT